MHLKNLNESFDAKYGFEDIEDLTADEIAYQKYQDGEYTYQDYCDICELEGCEPLEEGISDLVKAGVNKFRSGVSNAKADRYTRKGDYNTARAEREKANKFNYQATKNLNRFNDDDLATRSQSNIDARHNYQAKQDAAEAEYIKNNQPFLDSVADEFERCKDIKDLNTAYREFRDEFMNSSKTQVRTNNPVLKEIDGMYEFRKEEISGKSNNEYVGRHSNNASNDTKSSETTAENNKSVQTKSYPKSADLNDALTQALMKVAGEGELNVSLQELNSALPLLQQAFMHELNAKVHNK